MIKNTDQMASKAAPESVQPLSAKYTCAALIKANLVIRAQAKDLLFDYKGRFRLKLETKRKYRKRGAAGAYRAVSPLTLVGVFALA